MSRRLISGFLLFCALLAPTAAGQFELPPSIAHSVWTDTDGLPQNSVLGISQDSAGYLWISTFGGLARFDGRHFEVFDVLSRPDLPGNRFINVLHGRDGTMKVILLTMHEDVGLATAAIRAGASGYVLKHGPAGAVLRAIEEALQGGVHVSPPLAEGVMRALASGASDKPELTERQVEILRLLVEGLAAKEVAARLHLSRRTVEFHKYRMMERVGVTTSAELIAYALKRGIGPI